MGEITGITDLIALTRNKLMLPYTLLQISAKQRRGDKHVKNAVTALKEVVRPSKRDLASQIFSFNVSSPVIAVVDEDVKQGDQVVIPRGTQFIGNAAVLKSKDRVNIKFNVMVLPDGREIKVKAMALSLDGSGGIQGRVDRELDKSIFKAIGEVALSGAALAIGTRDRALTLEDQIRLNAARNPKGRGPQRGLYGLTDDAENALRRVKPEKSITIEAYTPILVLFLDFISL